MMMTWSPLLALAAALLSALHVNAHDNGMDMSMDGSMALSAGNMLPYLHFTKGDVLWFLGWVPTSTGAMVGACIGLFMLAIFERWLAACRALGEAHWKTRAHIVRADKLNRDGLPTSTTPSMKRSSTSPSESDEEKAPVSLRGTFATRMATPFIPAHDLSRGVIQATQTTLGFVFMLTVMTYQASFIISLVVGAGVGEAMFGRYASSLSTVH